MDLVLLNQWLISTVPKILWANTEIFCSTQRMEKELQHLCSFFLSLENINSQGLPVLLGVIYTAGKVLGLQLECNRFCLNKATKMQLVKHRCDSFRMPLG